MKARIRKDNLKYNYRQIQMIEFVMIKKEDFHTIYNRAAKK